MTQTAVRENTGIRLVEPRGPVSLALRVFVIPYLFLSLLFYGLVQLQYAVLGRVLLLHQHLRIAGLLGTLAMSVVYVFQRSELRVERPRLVTFVAVYAAYLALDFVGKAATGQVHFSALVYAETYLYFYVFFLLVELMLVSNIVNGPHIQSERGAFRALYLWAIPVFALGYLQFALNDPLVTVADESGYAVEVYINTKLAHVRAFSLFGSGFTYGHFATLIAALAASLLLDGRDKHQRAFFVGLLLAAFAAVITTYTRNAYVEFLVTLVGVAFIRRAIRRGWTNTGIVTASVAFCAAAYSAILGFFLAAPSLARGILDVETFGVRLLAVAGIVRRFFLDRPDPSSLLFGYGYMQGPKFAELEGIRMLIFDNTYLDVGLFSGLVGLAMYVAFFLLLFGYVLTKYRQTGSYWWLALAGMYFSYPLVAAINIYVSILYLITCLVLAYDALSKRGLVGSQPVPSGQA